MDKTFGQIEWVDLTVDNAEEVSEFYSRVVGWEKEPVELENYHDFNMKSSVDAGPVAGVCHRKGVSKDLPAQWLLYVSVENLDQSLKSCTQLGGKILQEARFLGEDRFAVIQDPAGAVMALYEKVI